MGYLESGISAKRENGRTVRAERQIHPLLQRNRSGLLRFFLFKRLDYFQWICTVAVFFFFVVLFQMFLPGLVVDKTEKSWRNTKNLPPDMIDLKEKGYLDFGDDVRFEPTKLLMKFQGETKDLNFKSRFNRTRKRFGYRKPELALVFANFLVNPQQLSMVTVAMALQETGYSIRVYSLEDGSVRDIWQQIRVPVTILQRDHQSDCAIDWLTYDGIIVDSLEARSIFSCFMQEPFKSLPLIWNINEETLAIHSRQYNSTRQIELLNDWKKIFNRASVIVFPNYLLPMLYSEFDAGNFYVIPGSSAEAWKAENLKAPLKDDTVIAVVGSQFLYRGLWLEHALVLQALKPLFSDVPRDSNENSPLKIIVLGGESASNYSMAVEAIALNLTYPTDAVKHIRVDGDVDEMISFADLVIYGSFREEQSFPEILVKAMSFGKPIIAPDLSNIRKYVDDRVNGYLFPKDNIKALTQITLEVISKGKISALAKNIASMGRTTVKNLMAQETVEGYAFLLHNVIKLSSEVASPRAIKEIPPRLRQEWQWNLFKNFLNFSTNENRISRSYKFLTKVEERWNHTQRESLNFGTANDDLFLYEIWQEEKYLQMDNTRKRREEEELKDRAAQHHRTWEEVYKSAKRADRSKNDLHERDEGELLRTGQPLCIYEPYFGEGTWPFLHHYSLYRGIGLSTKGRRPKTDDIDAPSRLPLLNNLYYRNTLGEYGAFFAISSRIDRIHKNAWIGFQSWRATARKASLSKTAENALLNAIQTKKHGDSVYFWVRMDEDPRNPLQQDFWSFCDATNAGNCRFAFGETLKKMYGAKHLDSLPPMAEDGDTWSVMQSWAMPTRSFLEFVMFSRMFVDALDSQMYEEHHQTGLCYLSLTKDKHCYSRLLELLVNVWAYHSARRMVYVKPETGLMQEQHKLKNRRGKMWVKWFEYTTLKTMDEDLAEEADSDRRSGHWLWPSTGEIFWQGSLEKERHRRNEEKERKKQRSREKLNRMRSRSGRQKVIGKYVKPPPEDTENWSTNSTEIKSVF